MHLVCTWSSTDNPDTKFITPQPHLTIHTVGTIYLLERAKEGAILAAYSKSLDGMKMLSLDVSAGITKLKLLY